MKFIFQPENHYLLSLRLSMMTRQNVTIGISKRKEREEEKREKRIFSKDFAVFIII